MKNLLITSAFISTFAIFFVHGMNDNSKDIRGRSRLDQKNNPEVVGLLGNDRSGIGQKVALFKTIFPKYIDEQYDRYCQECSQNNQSPLTIEQWWKTQIVNPDKGVEL